MQSKPAWSPFRLRGVLDVTDSISNIVIDSIFSMGRFLNRRELCLPILVVVRTIYIQASRDPWGSLCIANQQSGFRRGFNAGKFSQGKPVGKVQVGRPHKKHWMKIAQWITSEYICNLRHIFCFHFRLKNVQISVSVTGRSICRD